MIFTKKIIIAIAMLTQLVSAFNIDKLSPNASLTEVFSTNCLQMTNSQQMLESYIMLGIKSKYDDPKGTLERVIPKYDTRLHRINDYFQSRLKDENAKQAFIDAIKIWDESKKIMQKTPTKEGALKLKDNFRTMIKKLLIGTNPMANEGMALLSLTGKLCRGPMEITIDYLLKIWGVDMPDYDADMTNIIDAFTMHHKELSKNKMNNDITIDLLNKSEKGFLYFKYMYSSHTTTIPSLLYKKANDNFAIIRAIKVEYKNQITK